MRSNELKEILNIFIKKLDENKIKMENSQKILSSIEEKSEKIESFRPEIDLSELNKFKKSIQNQFETNEIKLKTVFTDFEKEITTTLRSNKDHQSKLYAFLLFLILLLLNFCFLTYGINQRKEKNEFKKASEMYKRNADYGAEFITEKNLTKEFKKWLEK